MILFIDFFPVNLNPKELQLLIKIKIKSLSPSQSPTFSLSSPLSLSPVNHHPSSQPPHREHKPPPINPQPQGNWRKPYTNSPFTSFFCDRSIPQTDHTRFSSPIRNISLSSLADYHEQRRSSTQRPHGSSHRQLQKQRSFPQNLAAAAKVMWCSFFFLPPAMQFLHAQEP